MGIKPAIPGLLYGIPTLVFLCFKGPITREFPSLGGYLSASLFGLLVVVTAMSVMIRGSNTIRFASPFHGLVLFYAFLIALVGGMHALGLFMAPKGLVINAQGVMAVDAFQQELYLAGLYLLFPAMLLTQLEVLGSISLNVIIRWVSVAGFLSASTVMYQVFFDHGFLHSQLWIWKDRYEGLGRAPNTLALTACLLIPFIVAGIRMETRKWLRIFYVLLIPLLVLAEFFTGSRTGAGGILLLLFLLPLILSATMNHWTFRRRVFTGVIPVVLLVLGFLLAPVIVSTLENTGGLGFRLAKTWHKFEAGGVAGIFQHGESRGRMYRLAGDLTVDAPWAGWGPGGFFREYSNIVYRQTGTVQKAVDTALNHYLMLAGDFGLPLTFLNLALILIPMLLGILLFRRLIDPGLRFLVAMIVACDGVFLMLIVTIPPSYDLDVLWVWSTQLALLFVMAARHGIRLRFPARGRGKVCMASIAAIVTLIVFAGSYQTSFGSDGYTIRQSRAWWDFPYERNCYPPEQLPEGRARWCGKDAIFFFEIGKNINAVNDVKYYIKVVHPDVTEHPVTVHYGPKDGRRKAVILDDYAWHEIYISVGRADIISITDRWSHVHRYIPFSIDVSRTWVPAQAGVGSDWRDLGVLLARDIRISDK